MTRRRASICYVRWRRRAFDIGSSNARRRSLQLTASLSSSNRTTSRCRRHSTPLPVSAVSTSVHDQPLSPLVVHAIFHYLADSSTVGLGTSRSSSCLAPCSCRCAPCVSSACIHFRYDIPVLILQGKGKEPLYCWVLYFSCMQVMPVMFHTNLQAPPLSITRLDRWRVGCSYFLFY